MFVLNCCWELFSSILNSDASVDIIVCDDMIIVDEDNKVLVALLVGVMVLIDGRIFKFGFTLTVGP